MFQFESTDKQIILKLFIYNQFIMLPPSDFNPTRGNLRNASRMAGGLLMPAPTKTSLKANLTKIFHITWIEGKINLKE